MRLTIKGELCDLNTFIRYNRSNKFTGAKIKKEETERVYYECRGKRVNEYPVHIEFNWYSKNERKDIDNVAFSKKFVLDGLVLAKVIENDSRKFVVSFTDKFFIDKNNPRVEIEITHVKNSDL